MSDNELDNLFKEAADGFKPPQDSSAWEDMAKRLDEVGSTTATAFWNWKVISSLVVVGITGVAVVWYLSLQGIGQQQPQDALAEGALAERKSETLPAQQPSVPSPVSPADQQAKSSKQ